MEQDLSSLAEKKDKALGKASNGKDPYYRKIIINKLTDAVMSKFARSTASKALSSELKKHIQLRLCRHLPEFHIPEHPTYAVMIQRAIAELRDEGGSTKESISSYIRDRYEDLPWAHATILEHHLKNLSEDGEIVCVSETYYMLAGQNLDTFHSGGPAKKQKRKRRWSRKQTTQAAENKNCQYQEQVGLTEYVSDEQSLVKRLEIVVAGRENGVQEENIERVAEEDRSSEREKQAEHVSEAISNGPVVEELMEHHPAEGNGITVLEEQISADNGQIEAIEKLKEAQEQRNREFIEQNREHGSQLEEVLEHFPAEEKRIVIYEEQIAEGQADVTSRRQIQSGGDQWEVLEKEFVVQEPVQGESMNDKIQRRGFEADEGCHTTQQESEVINGQNQHQQIRGIVDQIHLHEELIGSIEKLVELHEQQSQIVEEQNNREAESIKVANNISRNANFPNSSHSLKKLQCYGSLLSPMERIIGLLKKTRKTEEKLLELIYMLSKINASKHENNKCLTEREQHGTGEPQLQKEAGNKENEFGDVSGLEPQQPEASSQETRYDPQPTTLPSSLHLTVDTNGNKQSIEVPDSSKEDAGDLFDVTVTSQPLVIPERPAEQEPELFEESPRTWQEPKGKQEKLSCQQCSSLRNEKVTKVEKQKCHGGRGRPPKSKPDPPSQGSDLEHVTDANETKRSVTPPNDPIHDKQLMVLSKYRGQGRSPKRKLNADTSTDVTISSVVDATLQLQHQNQMQQPKRQRRGRLTKQKPDAKCQ